jgi:hypothetical protein
MRFGDSPALELTGTEASPLSSVKRWKATVEVSARLTTTYAGCRPAAMTRPSTALPA